MATSENAKDQDLTKYKYDAYFAAGDANAKLKYAAELDRIAGKSLMKSNPQAENALTNSRARGIPAIDVAPLQGQFLNIQCRLIGAKNVLEIGTLGGYSTIWFAQTGAKVTSIEINPFHREVALENCKGLDVDVILGAALDVLPKLEQEGRKFDLVFIDADWGEQWEYFQHAVNLTRKGGCIYIDNVVREMIERIEEGAKDDSLVDKIGKESRVTASMISTVASHKMDLNEMFDGFVIATVN